LIILESSFFSRGLLIGLSIAAPVGPIGVLCIRRTLAQGRTIGFITGLGAATADAAYGCVAGFGLTSISAFLVDQQTALRLLGGLFLLYLGARTWMAKPGKEAGSVQVTALSAAFASTLALTLTNPMTILSGFLRRSDLATNPTMAQQAGWWRACFSDRRFGGSS
jgi:threonine/homoserine/homoserine lactone efflux protein